MRTRFFRRHSSNRDTRTSGGWSSAPIIPFTAWAGISPLPPASSTQAHHPPRLAEVSFCALTRPLSRHLTMPRIRHVGGVSSSPSHIGPGVAHQLANPTRLAAERGKQRLRNRTKDRERKNKKRKGREAGSYFDRIARIYPTPPSVNPTRARRSKAAIGCS